MKEKNSFELQKDVDVYKWLKVVQSLILVALGVILMVTNIAREEGSDGQALGYSVAVILSLYGLLELFAGYLFHRSVFNQEIIFGTVAVALSVTLYVNPTIVNTLLFPFLIGALFTYAAVLVVSAIDEIVYKKSEKRATLYGVLDVLAAVIFVVAAIVFIIFNANEGEQVIRYLIVVMGAVLIALGIFLLVRCLVKAHETKKLLKEEANTPLPHKKKTSTSSKSKGTHLIENDEEVSGTVEEKEEEENKLLPHHDSSSDNAIEEYKEN